MRNLLFSFIMLLTSSIIAQNPCQQGTIIINGNDVDAIFVEKSDFTGFSLPLWLEEGSTLAAGTRIQLISVIEFNVINQSGNITLGFNQVKSIGTQTQTVPPDKVWKIEGIVKYANSFASGFSASSNSPVCAGTQLNLSATTISGATYSWTGPNGFTSSQQNPVISNVSLAAAGTYSMYATLNGCTSTASTTDVTVNALPPSTFTHNPTLPIANANITFTPALSGATYSWLFDQGTPSTSTAENPVVQWSAAGNYDVTLTITDNNGCTSSTLMVLTVSNCTPGQPSSAFTWTPSSPQPGESVTFNPATSGATYDWTFSGGSIGSSNVENPNVTWSSTGTYNVSLTVTSGGCSSTTAQNVTVKTPTIVTFNANGSGQSGSVQTFTVPAGVTSITIEAYGAQGAGHPPSEGAGGKGAYIKGDFTVSPGNVLSIIVGQTGLQVNNNSFGGGGGSFVWNNPSTLLVAAGGGGGAGINLSNNDGGDGSATVTPTAGSALGLGNASGGSGGNGGNGGSNSGGSYAGGGGGCGWNSNGLNGQSGSSQPTPGGGGKSPLNGGNGGDAGSSWGCVGGYGGGGGGGLCGGGGGGYNGGGGGNAYTGGATSGAGGGGGSYNGGTNQTNTAGVKTGHGQVKITY